MPDLLTFALPPDQLAEEIDRRVADLVRMLPYGAAVTLWARHADSCAVEYGLPCVCAPVPVTLYDPPAHTPAELREMNPPPDPTLGRLRAEPGTFTQRLAAIREAERWAAEDAELPF